MPAASETSLHEKIDQMLTEARVIFPGAQALMGFQLAVTMTKAFAELPDSVRAIHFMSLCFVSLAVLLLITPATVHRLTFRGQDVARFHRIGSSLVTAGLAPLILGLSADFYVASFKILNDAEIAAVASAAAALLLAGLWYAIPLLLRDRRAH